jgi:hypothetical protein
MTLSRRFLNLIMDSQIRGVRTLRRIDLTRQQFFNPGPPPPLHGNGSAAAAASVASESTMQRIRLARPIVTFRASAHDGRWAIQCFPLGENKVLCADQSGRTFLFDANTRHVVTMPSLHKPKDTPFSIFIPSASDDSNSDGFEDDVDDDVGTLFVMEGYPTMEPTSDDHSPNDQPSDEFVAYVYGKRKLTHFKSWKCQSLPPPPYVRDPTWMKFRPQITTYAVVGGGAQILISAESAGTYCMDTATHKWSHVGRWMLPLHGKIEYVPELDLWFGFSAKDQLSAVDLSNLDSRPRLVGTWKEFEPPEDWQESQEPQFVSLGSGKFCIARFFHTTVTVSNGYYTDDEVTNRSFGVLTGVEVLPRVYVRNGDGSANGSNGNGNASSNGNSTSICNGGSGRGNGNGGKRKLRMVKHKSRCHVSANGTVIESVF